MSKVVKKPIRKLLAIWGAAAVVTAGLVFVNLPDSAKSKGSGTSKDKESAACLDAKEKYKHWVTVGTDENMKATYLGKINKECKNKNVN
ncbi:hypothetical protein [Bacillus pseudomycoides]|uniref:Uncharacterized protein n=1 Tax=Bacillus pseudomycoides TaxID=64104 RepID=A0A2B6RX31_9BACI|nr:hypothetical protein [Bacillus pseudomycoides]PED73004.1 hypothetical protein CON97_06710 [Bacillus pseudomycoides]PEI45047.1 hypothetical protein CN620_02980 [Bacillus pseudomycoides]PEJ79523.1 hypothetical protein CN680_09270 [Bacillus pseudomycoides]PEM20024.1 hypothetical protein CN628_04475 [Bacillus pseudomycoides]PEM69781.1 hypothetical protein CN613_10265 [Bacillus pseudomycoides]